MARENAVAAGARQLWREIVQIRAAVRWLVEAEEKADRVCWAR